MTRASARFTAHGRVFRQRLPVMTLLLLVMLAGCREEAAVTEQAVSGLRIDTLLGGDADAGFRSATGPREFVFPRDHGAHPGYRSEWWYLTAVLTDAAGRDYGLQFTLFRQALTPQPTGAGPWHTGLAYLGHLAVTDVAAGKHHHAQRFSRGHPDLAAVTTTGPLHAFIEDWRLSGDGDASGYAFTLDAVDGQLGAQLTLQQTHAPVLQGEGGYSQKGPGQASYYYSMPRLQASGQIMVDAQPVAVTGLAWFDREWSTSVLPAELLGWDWFALQLNDGRSIMAFRLRRRDGQRDPYDHGMLIHEDQQLPTHLQSQDFLLTPERFWTDQRGASWPVAWTLRLGNERFEIAAMVDDQVMDTAVVYWEGIVAVRQNDARVGQGYMELTGYTGEDSNPQGGTK